jgi:hypothetical protein
MKPAVREELSEKLKQKPVKVVEREMNSEKHGDYDKQRNERQLTNLKYSINKKTRKPNEGSRCGRD